MLAASRGLHPSSRVAARPGRKLTVAAAFNPEVRPYTLRKGDSLDSIARKRDLTLREILLINPDVKDADNIPVGQTILLPASRLSARDREILDGIGAGYRIYPVRKGEKLGDIIMRRKITLEEMEKLNPGVNLNRLKDHQLLKLPGNKFTVREREMLIGSGIVPKEFFSATKNPFFLGASALATVCTVVMIWQRFYRDEDEEYAEKMDRAAAARKAKA